MHGWFWTIWLIHLIGQTSLHFEKNNKKIVLFWATNDVLTSCTLYVLKIGTDSIVAEGIHPRESKSWIGKNTLKTQCFTCSYPVIRWIFTNWNSYSLFIHYRVRTMRTLNNTFCLTIRTAVVYTVYFTKYFIQSSSTLWRCYSIYTIREVDRTLNNLLTLIRSVHPASESIIELVLWENNILT